MAQGSCTRAVASSQEGEMGGVAGSDVPGEPPGGGLLHGRRDCSAGQLRLAVSVCPKEIGVAVDP